jgi:hypothetical protein
MVRGGIRKILALKFILAQGWQLGRDRFSAYSPNTGLVEVDRDPGDRIVDAPDARIP